MQDNSEGFDWDAVFTGIRRRFDEVKTNPRRGKSFLDHVYNLQNWEADGLTYPSVTPVFPDRIFVAYAVCQPDCGEEQLIVEGGTQECQRCGRLMFRVETMCYQKS
ncbi:hypothetical protein Ms3S1_p20840 (plasmid) [Methylosinus sp. 3S-1]|uniref:Uncharacterized protein n=2 Tax=Methylocystaceae TaxID=31993 RepID=A0A2D2D7J2_METT3|nr:hypothetical protein CQW49_23830 [Methylosinus trichosporium OB3b]